MKKFKIWFAVILMAATTQLCGQKNTENIVGKWKTEDNTIVEFLPNGSTICIKQLVAAKEKDKKDNGKLLGKDLVLASKNQFNGIMIDPSNNKEYKATIILSEDGKSLVLKVKWGFINFNETWKKI
jgi:uncharacterized protein (DUF2147 family)